MADTRQPSQDPRARASFADGKEIDDFVSTLGRYERGELDADAWRSYRVARGAYSQRQEGVHMLRVKIPQGIATAEQLRVLAAVVEEHACGYAHLTTRQNLQAYYLRPADLEPALRKLAAAGITTSGAGGNAVRNVVACPLAGVSPTEPFDVTPYAEALSRHFLRHPLASTLPRKFKIALEGCAEDHVATSIQDLGLRAALRAGPSGDERGFRVTIAGGTSSLPTNGARLFDFLPAGDLLALAEALVRLFHARGDRVNRSRNRLKFLVKDLGFEPFRALVEEELAKVRAAGVPPLPFPPQAPPVEGPPRFDRPKAQAPEEIAIRLRAQPPRGLPIPPPWLAAAPQATAIAAFMRTNVQPQRQEGFSVVTISAPRGEIAGAQLDVLADLSLAYGDGAARFSGGGQILLRWVADADVQPLAERLAAAGLLRDAVGSAADVVACPGADVCRLAVMRTRNVAGLIEEEIRTKLGAAALETRLPVHVSGCPNGCSQHHLAAIGLQGSVRRVGDRIVPQFFVLVGGGTGPDGARFTQLAGKVPARRAPEAVRALTALYLAERSEGESANAYFRRALDRAKFVIAPFEALRAEELTAEDYLEPGGGGSFAPDVQASECAA
ncbi:MAG TPA: nitrite/sulfite reductase [Anaeromyxobacteraceae bacterium]|nr:nitrite/sulfite reductase [Anaeromyxobacteraceae bacterium]